MTSRTCKARLSWQFSRGIFLKYTFFFMKYWYFSELSCDKKNLKWIFIWYSIYDTRWVFYIPSPNARGYKTHNSFHKHRMKLKLISDPIYIAIFFHCIAIYCDTLDFSKFNNSILALVLKSCVIESELYTCINDCIETFYKGINVQGINFLDLQLLDKHWIKNYQFY